MEEVRQLVQEEGREARNLVAFHVSVDTPARVSRKPPRALPPPRRAAPRTSRLRSASAGRDKRSELRARYWALLFGDLQRAVGEIYNTVEAHENLNECQEVILVLENYTRDFKALGEWFRLKWEYDNTPPPQRPQSLAWEIRKTDFVRPESRRTYSMKSSPSVSGKNSPCLSGHNTPSGKNSPNLTGKASPGSGKISPRITHPTSSPKANVEFFTNKLVASKITAKPEPKIAKESRLSDIKEKEVKVTCDVSDTEENLSEENNKVSTIETGLTKEVKNALPQRVAIKLAKSKISETKTTENEISDQCKTTIAQLDAMENEFLKKNLIESQVKNDNMINQEMVIKSDSTFTSAEDKKIEIKIEENDNTCSESPTKSEDNFADISSESSPKSEVEKPDNKKDQKNKCKKTSNCNTKQIEEKKVAQPKKQIIEIKEAIATKEEHKVEELENDIDTNIINNNNIEPVNQKDIKDISNSETAISNGWGDVNSEKMNTGLNFNNVEEIRKISALVAKTVANGPSHLSNEIKTKNDFSLALDNVQEENIKNHIQDVQKILENDKKSKEIKDITKEVIMLSKDEVDVKKEIEVKKLDNKQNNDSKQSKPAYSQAVAKPKAVNITKNEVKTPTRLIRSSTVVEIRPSTVAKQPKTCQKKTNKCSYPFNLTTGRTTLFDGVPATPATKPVVTKRPIIKSNQNMAGGDAKPVTGKENLKKRPPRPTSLIAKEKEEKKNRVNQALEKVKDCKDYSSSDSVITQIDISRIESSESLKTLVSEDHQVLKDVANSIEVLNVDSNKNDNEGWLTVKSRRLSRESKKHSKSHWANRFNQPSATTSLPTLNMLESPKQEDNSILNPKPVNVDRAKSEQPQTQDDPPLTKIINGSEQPQKPQLQEKKTEKPEKVVKVVAKLKSENKTNDPSMIRQKSDVTGLKTKSSRNKVLTKKAEKVKDSHKDDDMSDLTKNRLHSSLESLTSALARSQESTEEAFDFDKWKAEFKSTFKYLEEDDQIADQTEILKSADPSEMSEIAAMTSQIEENERKISLALDFQSEVDQRKLCAEEDLLNRQILELQQVSDIDIDTETDDTETDAEILIEDPPQVLSENLGSLAASLEDQYETALAGMTWAERVDTLVVLEALVARDPGRAQQLHEKLSQGIKRRGSLQDALRRLQAKQARAERQRMEYQTERSKKIHQLLARVEEVKVAKNQLIEEKRMRMERRLQKAAENRDQHLKDIVRKAHDEEEKLREIAFIKQLEAENRRHEFLEQCRSHTTRLRGMRRDRLHKLEQKAAREAAVGARRQAIEAARKLHVENLMERRKERDARVEEMKGLKKQERDDAAREKAEGVKSRLSALAAAAELEADALRSRIRDKQDASQQRLESHLQAIREKATGPRPATISESQDQAEKEDLESKRIDQERKEREKQKAVKRKARKIKQKLLAGLVLRSQAPVFEDNITTLDTMLNPLTSKVYRAISSIRNIMAPFVPECEKDDDEKEKEKEKEKKQTPQVNGEAEKNKEDPSVNGECSKFCEPSTSGTQNVPEVKSKKKKKKKNNNNNNDDKGRWSKASSVCSSLIEMNRNARIERKIDIDLPYLEKQMNELYRMMEKFEKHFLEKASVQRFQAVKVISQMLAVAAEKEDLNPPISAKCLTNAVTLVSRVMVSCTATAAQILSTNTCVHQATLLCRQMEKDLKSNEREMELAKQLCDSLSVALDSVLCASRLHHDEETPDEELEILGLLRNRAHMIISYLCLNGCIANAEHAGEARESIQTLLTVCADLCGPFVADVGNDKMYAKQALRTALGKGVCGSRAEFCMLFAKGASLGECGDFVKAARTAHLLRSIAEMDHLIVQDAFGEGGWPLEFRAAVARLLSQHAPNEKEAPRTTALRLSNQRLDQKLSETMVLDLIVLVGFVVVNNPQLQETICDGWGVLKTLCTLPANWLVSETRSHALLPTLIALSERKETAAIIASELNMKILDDFMKNPQSQEIKLIQVIKQTKNKKGKK
ncbi:S phase cyclin A-associated protein in the endoplasmic reticulum isoform X2 [Danaus plexippus]|uniref:S phase cyclin A-associated protein in the endoplasmic reticulum isoform X2 n=1 Tax=Danaus plexippus TaxID=13037 RepID=UPI002AB27FC9|nr:S phase cyclin A-associated protein in the endoplasmic reticulum isoform X2 [Danaus plexippus]